MFWGWKKEVKVVDCPGLVCPSLVGLELQVSGPATAGLPAEPCRPSLAVRLLVLHTYTVYFAHRLLGSITYLSDPFDVCMYLLCGKPSPYRDNLPCATSAEG